MRYGEARSNFKPGGKIIGEALRDFGKLRRAVPLDRVGAFGTIDVVPEILHQSASAPSVW